MQKLLKKVVGSMLYGLDLGVVRLSVREKFNIPFTTKAIGASGAAEVFSHYIANHGQLASDAEIVSFMDFYCDNWSLSSSQWSQDVFVMYVTNMMRGGFSWRLVARMAILILTLIRLKRNLAGKGLWSSLTQDNSGAWLCLGQAILF